MKKIFSLALGLSALIFAPSLSQAGDHDYDEYNIYAGLHGGGERMLQANSYEATEPTAFKQTFDFGWNVGGQVGMHPTDNSRLEFEGTYAVCGADRVTSAGAWNNDSGERQSIRLMVNFYYDFELENHDITPYVGAGVGPAYVDVEVTPSTAVITAVNDDEWVFAYQVIGGISVPLSDEVDGFFEYRMVGTSKPKITDTAGAAVTTEHQSQSIAVGANFHF